jgi:DNA (cytosine-5)-methyltransferase 1
MRFIEEMNPAIAIIENVPAYTASASYSILKAVLSNLGYQLQLRYFQGAEFGALEDRQRMILVALTDAVATGQVYRSSPELFDPETSAFNLEEVRSPVSRPVTLEEIIDPAADGYKARPHLVAKEQKDRRSGKGFRLQWLDPQRAEKVGTIGAGYAKVRSTEPMVIHPEDRDNPITEATRVRLLTPAEHARVKTIPEHLIAGVSSATCAHEILGQSGIYNWFCGSRISSGIKPHRGLPVKNRPSPTE